MSECPEVYKAKLKELIDKAKRSGRKYVTIQEFANALGMPVSEAYKWFSEACRALGLKFAHGLCMFD